MNEFTVTMQIAKETKNTYMFKELDDQGRPIESMYGGKIGQLYVKKSNFAERPQYVQVTIQTKE